MTDLPPGLAPVLPPSLTSTHRPLEGHRVLVPRAEGSAAMLVGLLQAAGADVAAVPLLAIDPPAELGELDVAVLTLAAGEYDWVGFASANAVAAVVDRAAELAVPTIVAPGTRVAAVGAATAAAVRTAGLPVDLRPTGSSSAAGLVAVWPHPGRSGSRVLLPSSAIGLPTLPAGLEALGYLVDRVIAYAPRVLTVPDDIAADLRAGAFGAVLLTSPSIVAALGTAGSLPAGMLVGAIGRTTATAAADAGLAVSFIADQASMAALTDGLIAAVAHQRTSLA